MERKMIGLLCPDLFIHPKLKDLSSDVVCMYITTFAIGVEYLPREIRVLTIQSLVDAGLGDFDGERFVLSQIQNKYGRPLIWIEEEEPWTVSAKDGVQ